MRYVFRGIAAVAIAVALLVNSGVADLITVGTFKGSADLNLRGPFYLAANVGSTSLAGVLSVGNATFLPLSAAFNDTAGKASIAGVSGGDLDPYAATPAYVGPGAANLDAIMHSLSYTSGGPMTATVNGLTPNQTYEIQVLVSENSYQQIASPGVNGRDFGISVNGNVAFPNNSDIIALSYPGATAGVNQWNTNPTQGIVVTDVFRTGPSQTTATIQAIYGASSAGHDPNAFFNAFTVQAAPEPASLVLAALGAVGLFVAARRRRRA